LRGGIATDKVVERLNVWLSSIDREGEVVILEVEANAWKIDNGLDASLAELLGVTCC
jgi:hypothetical protein